MTDAPRISAFFFANAVKTAALAGVSAETLCAHARISQAQLNLEDGKPPFHAYLAILAETANRTGDEFFWLREYTADLLPMNNPLWYVIFSAPNLRQALERAKAFYHYYSDVHYPACQLYPDEFSVRVAYHLPEYRLSGHALDWALAAWWGVARQFAGPGLKLKAVRLTPEHNNRQWAYQKFFGTVVQTCHEYCGLLFERALLELPNASRNFDANLDSILLDMAKRCVKTTEPQDDFLSGLQEEIRQQVRYGPPGLKTVATRLNLSVRSLQRRLEETGTSFSEQITKVRSDLAISYLSRPGMRVSAVASLLGFKNNASFSAAFNKWFGVSPSEYRRQQQAKTDPSNVN